MIDVGNQITIKINHLYDILPCHSSAPNVFAELYIHIIDMMSQVKNIMRYKIPSPTYAWMSIKYRMHTLLADNFVVWMCVIHIHAFDEWSDAQAHTHLDDCTRLNDKGGIFP